MRVVTVTKDVGAAVYRYKPWENVCSATNLHMKVTGRHSLPRGKEKSKEDPIFVQPLPPRHNWAALNISLGFGLFSHGYLSHLFSLFSLFSDSNLNLSSWCFPFCKAHLITMIDLTVTTWPDSWFIVLFSVGLDWSETNVITMLTSCSTYILHLQHSWWDSPDKHVDEVVFHNSEWWVL